MASAYGSFSQRMVLGACVCALKASTGIADSTERDGWEATCFLGFLERHVGIYSPDALFGLRSDGFNLLFLNGYRAHKERPISSNALLAFQHMQARYSLGMPALPLDAPGASARFLITKSIAHWLRLSIFKRRPFSPSPDAPRASALLRIASSNVNCNRDITMSALGPELQVYSSPSPDVPRASALLRIASSNVNCNQDITMSALSVRSLAYRLIKWELPMEILLCRSYPPSPDAPRASALLRITSSNANFPWEYLHAGLTHRFLTLQERPLSFLPHIPLRFKKISYEISGLDDA
ncbi:hypothetical protein CPB84DRAFT_1853986 [Gymnopilus junonius]|uniref:Uncharacterized protein n=1 Tax=Gymnopilus junonius TaxID=109634 RepID=A0A9P5N9V7_GYMJU|nr:hypothetical protein CPB84DRAFT_1853986 [Gymnopilus junonius]